MENRMHYTVTKVPLCCLPTPILKHIIRKYTSTSCVGMEQVQNGVLYLRYRNDFMITKAERCKAFTQKTFTIL